MKRNLIRRLSLGLACFLGMGKFINRPTFLNKARILRAESDYRYVDTISGLSNQESNDLIIDSRHVKDFYNTNAIWSYNWDLNLSGTGAEHTNFMDMPTNFHFTAERDVEIKYLTSFNSVSTSVWKKWNESEQATLNVKITLGSKVLFSNSKLFTQTGNIVPSNTAVANEPCGKIKLEFWATNATQPWTLDFSYLFLKGYKYKPINVELNDGTGASGGSGTTHFTYGEAIPDVNVPSRPGYRFDGYYSGTEQYYDDKGKPTISEFTHKVDAFSLEAKWTLMQFDVTLDDNGGSGGQGKVVATSTYAMPTLTSLPTREGYIFKGYWNAKSDGTQYYDENGNAYNDKTYDLTSATTLYARWEAIEYHSAFDPAPGTGGITQVDIYYDSTPDDLTLEQIPTRETSSGHSYSFGGYYTEKPTDNSDGSQTPNGKQYYDEFGKGVGLWKEASDDTVLYAYWTIDMTVNSSSWSGTWASEDGNPNIGVKRGISVTAVNPADAVIWYGTSAGQCNSTNADEFLYSDAGVYEVFFEVRKDGYTTYYGCETITINKGSSIIDPRPSPKEHLEYTALEQELIVAGQVDYGEMLYALNQSNEIPDESEFSFDIPLAKDVGTYYVFYKSSGDFNHNPYAVVKAEVITVNIARVDRSKVTNLNDEVLQYLNAIKDKYPDIAQTLEAIRGEVYQDAIVEDNITTNCVNQNIDKLQEALSAAKVAVTEELIKAIGTVSYPESEEAIQAAKDYFDDVLTEDEQKDVDSTLLDALNKNVSDYNDAKEVASLINAIPAASDSEEYYSAVENAKKAYDDLASSNPDAYALLNDASDIDYEVILQNNIDAKEVIELIESIGELTYNMGEDDSLKDIEEAEAKYQDLASSNPAAKAIVDQANLDNLIQARESYDDVDETVRLIAEIGEVSLGGDEDSKEAIQAAREAYNALSEEEKSLVNNYEESYKTLEDDEHVYQALVLIDEIDKVEYNSESGEKIAEARNYYDSLTDDQKAQIGDKPLTSLIDSEMKYAEMKKNGNILLIVFLIVSSLILLGGIWFMIIILKKKNNQDDKKEKAVENNNIN